MADIFIIVLPLPRSLHLQYESTATAWFRGKSHDSPQFYRTTYSGRLCVPETRIKIIKKEYPSFEKWRIFIIVSGTFPKASLDVLLYAYPNRDKRGREPCLA